MILPLSQACASDQAMSRIPFGGSAVLDIAWSLRACIRGAVSRKGVRFLLAQVSSSRPMTTSFRRMGLGDFGGLLNAQGFWPCGQLAGQMEAPIPRRTPFMHLVALVATSLSADRSTTNRCLISLMNGLDWVFADV